jgi:hypothetical protein
MFDSIQMTLSKLGLFDIMVESGKRIALIIFGALAVVYIFGRYLNIAKTDRSKNAIGIICMLLFSVVTIGWLDYSNILISGKYTVVIVIGYIFSVIMHFLISILMYAFICWGLFDKVKAFKNKYIPTKEKVPRTPRVSKVSKKK